MRTIVKEIVGCLKLIGNHWFLFVLYGGVCLLIGGVGEDLGVPYLFRDDPELGNYGIGAYRNSPTFLTQAAAAFLSGVLWTFARLLEEPNDGWRGLVRRTLPPAAVLALIPLLAAAFVAPSAGMPEARPVELLRMILGTVVGLLILTPIFVYLGHKVSRWRVAEWCGVRRPSTFLLVFVSIVILALLYRKLVPAISIFLLVALVSAGYVALQLFPRHWRVVGFILLIVLIMFGNGVAYKYQFPGFETAEGSTYYDDGKRVELADPLIRPRSVATYEAQQKVRDQSAASLLIDPLTNLRTWRSRFGDNKPKLVLVATSGGAYRAAFWTAIVLDSLEERSKDDGELPGFTGDIRVITGASGGMVGAAYFVAMRRQDNSSDVVVTRLEDDTRRAQEHTRLGTKFPIPRDSLSPVAQQLAQHDVLGTVIPWAQAADRGRALELQWPTLDKSFSWLRRGEVEGWRPSLILSPMLIETGQPLLISNLDLSSIRDASLNEAVEFFRWFPGVHDSFHLRTAVRMNATFPYVSPAVSLPTDPPRRVVDAGYYDNYGINLIVAYLREPTIREWVEEQTSGVIIVQIRAFPIESVGEDRGIDLCRACIPNADEERIDNDDVRSGAAFHWLTSPIEGAAAARNASMVFRNNQELRALRDLYSPEYIKWVTFENAAKAGMSWYLPGAELECMRKELGSAYNQKQLTNLKLFWASNR